MPVGKTLAAERRSQNKTLTEIQAQTRIMGRLLDALEHERWDELPAPVYVKGYIQNYAEVLGLDPAPLLDEYRRDRDAHTPAPVMHILDRAIVPHRREVHAVPRTVWIALAVIVPLIALVIWGIAALVGRDDSPPPIPPVTPSPSVDATTLPGVPADEATVTTGTVSEGLGDAFELVISVRAGESSWLSVTVDGLTAYEGTLPGGQEKTFSVSEEAIVRVGRPQSVSITRDGDPVDVPVGTGVAEVRLTAADE